MRLGGVDKALINYQGKDNEARPVIAHLSRLLGEQTARVYISRQADQLDVSQYGEIIIDPMPDCGPLAGVYGASEAARQAGFDYLLTIPCDHAFVPADLLARLFACRDPHSYMRAGEDFVPVFALYDLAHCEGLREFAMAERSLRAWFSHFGAGIAQFPPLERAGDLSANYKAGKE